MAGVLNPSGKIIGGSVFTPFRGYIDGLITANATDADHDITIAEGEATDSTKSTLMTLSSAMTKQIDASWSVGNGNGGLFTGSVANSTWYHMFLIKNSNGNIDCGFDTSVTAANRPSGWTYYRRIGAVKTDGSSNILGFVQFGDKFLWKASVLDVNGGTVNNTSSSLVTLSVPSGVNVRPIFAYEVYKSAVVSTARVSCPSVNDEDPYALTLGYTAVSASGAYSANTEDEELTMTDTSSRIRIRSNNDSTTYWVRTAGWIDPRGKDS